MTSSRRRAVVYNIGLSPDAGALTEDLVTRKEKRVKKYPIVLDTGQKREGRLASSRLFFVYVTPTGAEVGLNQCPAIRAKYRRPMGFDGNASGNSVLTEYEVSRPCRIKMVNNHSRLGRPAVFVNMYLDLDEDHALIELRGLEGFGGFRGKGKIDTKNSTVVDRSGNSHRLTDKVLKELFTFKVLQAPKGAASKKNVRSLIY